jgi:putative endopeptidase
MSIKKNKFIALSLAASLVASNVTAQLVSGFDPKTFDKSVKPQDDFFQYINGGWIKQNPIPATESRWGNFNILAEQNLETQRKILETAAAITNEEGSASQKIGTFYKVAMDTVKLEKEGFKPVANLFDQTNNATNGKDFAKLVGEFHQQGISGFFSVYVGLDVKDNEKYVVWFSQSGLSLPDKDYYSKQDEKSKKIREEFKSHIKNMYLLYGRSEGDAVMASRLILDFETKLAQRSMSRVDNRNMEKKYNKRALSQVFETYPNFDWNTYLETVGIPLAPHDSVVVAHLDFFDNLNRLFTESDPMTFKLYMNWKVMQASSGYLNNKIGQESFRFYGSVLQGTKEQKPRWKRAVASSNSMVGELLAQEYVKVAFSEEAKVKVNEMVDNLKEAYRMRIQNLDWMSAVTKQKALEKLDAFNRKLGYPDQWKDYSELRIVEESYWEIYQRCSKFGYKRMVEKLGTTVDRTEWNMLPQTVNAYYSPTMNEIVFPAAIMQPPFFNPNADDAVNYGAIGAVIGHEFSHGFDDQGSKYDAKGNLNTWWTEDDRSKFEARTQLLVNQFNEFQPLDSVYVNGQLTLGENIADLAGLTVAYDAYMISLKNKPKSKIDGFTPEQRFFIGFAQVWRGHSRPEYVRNQVVTDPHSPQQYRVIGTLSNMPEFYQAFGVKKGNKMWREDSKRVKIW